jgi:hypothetical protein
MSLNTGTGLWIRAVDVHGTLGSAGVTRVGARYARNGAI